MNQDHGRWESGIGDRDYDGDAGVKDPGENLSMAGFVK